MEPPREFCCASSPCPVGGVVLVSTHSQPQAGLPSDVQQQPDPASEAMGPSRLVLPFKTNLGLWWLLLIPAGERGRSPGHPVTRVSAHALG